MGKFFKRFWLAIETLQSVHGLVTYLLPIIAPVGVFMVGFWGSVQVPLYALLTAALLAFAAIATGLLRYDEWRFRNKVKDKVSFSALRIGRQADGEGICLGFDIHNSAFFPIEFTVKTIRTKLRDQSPKECKENPNRKYTMPIHGNGWYLDCPIDLHETPKPGSVEGFIEFKVLYSKLGSDKSYELTGKKQIVVSFNEEGVPTTAAWNDAI